MKYIDEFRKKDLIKQFQAAITSIVPRRNINIMEVCGTHTQSLRRFGLEKLLPANLRLIAGPGCPVCVSSQEYIDSAIKLACQKDVIIVTFGDMLRIPGTHSTLEKQRARFGNVQVVYSALDSLHIAKLNAHKKIVFLAVGFETTAPTIGLSIISAKKQNLKNLFFLSSLKLIPPALKLLAEDKRLNLDGFLCPGHVSAIIGTKAYEFIARKYGIACCVAGFEPLDILEGVYLLLNQIVEKRCTVQNQYMRVVTKFGNSKAQKIIRQVFRTKDDCWRGLGEIPESGLKIRKEFAQFDAERVFSLTQGLKDSRTQETKCKCGDVLKGLIAPPDCPLFSKLCQPDNPIGPCMVSSEGACNAYYRYH